MLAIAPYFGGRDPAGSDMSLDALFEALERELRDPNGDWLRDRVRAHADLARSHGLRLVAYEIDLPPPDILLLKSTLII